MPNDGSQSGVAVRRSSVSPSVTRICPAEMPWRPSASAQVRASAICPTGAAGFALTSGRHRFGHNEEEDDACRTGEMQEWIGDRILVRGKDRKLCYRVTDKVIVDASKTSDANTSCPSRPPAVS